MSEGAHTCLFPAFVGWYSQLLCFVHPCPRSKCSPWGWQPWRGGDGLSSLLPSSYGEVQGAATTGRASAATKAWDQRPATMVAPKPLRDQRAMSHGRNGDVSLSTEEDPRFEGCIMCLYGGTFTMWGQGVVPRACSSWCFRSCWCHPAWPCPRAAASYRGNSRAEGWMRAEAGARAVLWQGHASSYCFLHFCSGFGLTHSSSQALMSAQSVAVRLKQERQVGWTRRDGRVTLQPLLPAADGSCSIVSCSFATVTVGQFHVWCWGLRQLN